MSATVIPMTFHFVAKAVIPIIKKCLSIFLISLLTDLVQAAKQQQPRCCLWTRDPKRPPVYQRPFYFGKVSSCQAMI